MADELVFPGFTSLTTPYKKVQEHKILAGILVPKVQESNIHPVIVRFHGGFLFTGSHNSFFQPWLKEYAKVHSAVVVSADYRLMPEGNGLDIMQDLKDFWSWVFNDLPSFLGDEVVIDLSKVLIEGDSAGGYLAIQSALSMGNKVRGMIAVYPPADIKIPFFTTAYERNMVGFPMYPADTVERHVATLKGNEVVSNVQPPARLELGFSAIQQGKFITLLGDDPSLFPMERLEHVKEVPSIVILHGREDSAVPYQSSEAFMNKIQRLHPETRVFYSAVSGCEHGLDQDATLETPWLKEGLDIITPLWLR